MIIDHLVELKKYDNMLPKMDEIIHFLSQHDWTNIADGTLDAPEGMKAFVQTLEAKTEEQSLEKFECHDQFIDLQYLISGVETFAWKSRKNCVVPKGDYNMEKDVRYFSDEPDIHFLLQPGHFAIFYPSDVHAPAIGTGTLKKLIIKIPVI
ncbi:MAG: YhcH/YjgK/YiaL family protein [Flavobacterium sp. BFFFF2]|nr:MAG: YhcH/YjgK/YiaL family protein [Flavobacterium sp. BFFFF2]